MGKNDHPLGKVYLTYEEYSNGHYPTENSGEWERWTNFTPLALYIENVGCTKTVDAYFDIEHQTGHSVYIVVVRYSTGDSFGIQHGAWCVVGAYKTAKRANKIVEQIEKGAYKSKRGYNEWEDHFASLESVNLYSMILQGDKKEDEDIYG